MTLGYVRSTFEGRYLQDVKQIDSGHFLKEGGPKELDANMDGESVLSETDSYPGASARASTAKVLEIKLPKLKKNERNLIRRPMKGELPSNKS